MRSRGTASGNRSTSRNRGAARSRPARPPWGGILFLTPVFIITVILNLANLLSGVSWGKAILRLFNFAEGSPLIGKSILLPILVLAGFGYLGARDDLAGVRGKQRNGQGMLARFKASYQTLLALATALGLYFFLDLHSVAVPGLAQKVNLGPHLHPDSRLHHRGDVQRRQFHGRAGRAGRINVGSGLRRLRCDRFPATTVPVDVVLLHDGRRLARVSVVQQPSGRAVHGGRRRAGIGRHPGSGGPDDRPMAAAAHRGGRLCGRGCIRYSSDRLLQVDEAPHRPGQAHLQDGALALSLRAARLVGDPCDGALLPHRHPGSMLGIALALL